ncbi:MAG: hypothetical protein PHE79_04690 [Eubacteriales bacterium]|nr:hypothetical protein [Eubacteriales bacterium]
MDWNTIVIIITVIGCFVGLSGWLMAREGRISNDGEWRGTVNAKLDTILGINAKVEKVEADLREHEGRLSKVEGSASSAHKRLDDHIREKQ